MMIFRASYRGPTDTKGSQFRVTGVAGRDARTSWPITVAERAAFRRSTSQPYEHGERDPSLHALAQHLRRIGVVSDDGVGVYAIDLHSPTPEEYFYAVGSHYELQGAAINSWHQYVIRWQADAGVVVQEVLP
jgi:hypothetical protein